MNECEKYREMMSAMLDGELDAGESERLIAHLSLCAECRELYELLSAVSGSEVWELPEVPEGLHEHIMSGVKSAASVRKKEGLMRKIRPWTVAAACLVLIVGVILGVPRVFRMGSSSYYGAFNTTASASGNSAPAAAHDNAATDTAAPTDAAENGGLAQDTPTSGSSDGAFGDINYASNNQSGTPEADVEGAPTPEPEAAPGEPEEVEALVLELDIESSVVTVESGGKSVSKELNRDDTLIWLRAVIYGSAGDSIVAAKLEVSRSEGEDYEVYFYHDRGKLMGSLTEDLENGIVLDTLADFAQFEEMADGEK